METKQNLDDKLQTKEELFKEIIDEKENKIKEIQSTLEFMHQKIKDLENENFVYEEMINRYKLKVEKMGDYFLTEASNNNSSL